ncbi:MAG: hypothetical protein OET90_02845, partial [Desulfuromonadales bacterium]|nr:hypothetical protein [Desulfuromonadales bacterium]
YPCPSNGSGSKHGNLGARYWLDSVYDLAEQETRRAIEHDPNCSMWHQNLGFILDSQGRKFESIQSLLKSIEVDNNWCSSFKTGSHLKLGMLYYRTRNHEESINALMNAFRSGKNEKSDDMTMRQILIYLSYNYTDSKGDGAQFYNLKSALELTKKAAEHTPGELSVEFSFAKIFALGDKHEEAEAKLEQIISRQEKSDEPSPYAYVSTAFIYSIMSNPVKSAKYAEKAIDLYPGYANYLLEELDKDFVNVASSEEMAPVIAKAQALLR